jgi:hypothetical protein
MPKCSHCAETKGVVAYGGPNGDPLCGSHWRIRAQADAVAAGKQTLCEDCIKPLRPEGIAGLLHADQGECRNCHRQARVYFWPP